MTEKQPSDEPRVWCRRLERELPVREHADCAYCFASRKAIAEGKHAEFCDFKPGVDPIHFGFPPDSSRHEHG